MLGRLSGGTQVDYHVKWTRIGHLCRKGKPLRECIQLLFATEKRIKIASAGPGITLGGQSCVKGWQSGRGVECPGIAAVGVFDRRRVGPCLVKTQQLSHDIHRLVRVEDNGCPRLVDLAEPACRLQSELTTGCGLNVQVWPEIITARAEAHPSELQTL